MPSTASTVISTVVDYGRFIGLGLALILALATILVGFVGTFGPHWAFALMTVVAWNVLTVFQGFIEYIHLRRDMEDVDWYFKNLKIKIPAEKTLGWFPWWETIIVISLALWFWHPFYAAILTLCIIVLYSYIFLDLLQKRLEEIYEVLFLAYNFHQTNINAEVEKIKMIFTGYDEEVLECLKDIKKFQRSRKN
ncbi:hypothetical protein L5515_002589 [Caenorhabditis briggsae]|uniref:Uncharacterized protein n=1 Tax=Caenorhabditis briggsae TaxID=6238 RepID=A0AAE9E9B6_CAEBR|nr:hypothetical protein L5515_002589 [Caenorhabditis briggsae]